MPFDGGVAMLHTTNHLIGHFEGCDGLKTGFTFQAGFNFTATAKRGNLRFISVILGAPSPNRDSRNRHGCWSGASSTINQFLYFAAASRCRCGFKSFRARASPAGCRA